MRALAEAGSIVVRSGGRVLVATLASVFVFCLSGCVLPFFFGAWMLGRTLGAVLELDAIRPARALVAGLVVVVSLAPPVLALVVGGPGSAAVSAVIGGLVLAPFLTVAAHHLRSDAPLGHAIGRSATAFAVRGLGTGLARGGLLGVVIGSPHFVLAASGEWYGGVAIPIILLGIPAATSLALALQRPWSDDDDRVLAGVASPTTPRATWIAPGLAAGMLVVGTLLAAWVPAAAYQRLLDEPPRDACTDALRDVGPHSLTITHSFDAFDVQTRDGGGAGSVRGDRVRGPSRAIEVCEVERGYLLRFAHADALVDETGVRLDDGIAERLRARSFFGPWLIALALGSLLALGVVARRRLRHLRALAAIERAHGLFVVSGRLEPSGAALGTGVDTEVRGEVTFVSSAGDLRLRLPPRVTLLGPDGEVPSDATLRLCAPSAPGTMGLRTGTEAWPEEAILLVGDVEPARSALLSGMTRRTAPWVAIVTAALALAALELLVRL